jgi:uncharacterized protein YbjT (DUF2867 family)
MILITGATGNVGTELARVLSARAVPFRAMVRSPEAAQKVEALAGAKEGAIRSSGLAFTFLRPNLFMQGLLGFRDSIVREGRFYAAAGDARISAVDVRDIAAVAAEALTGPGHEGRTYDLTGPEALTHAEMADRISAALGRPIE